MATILIVDDQAGTWESLAALLDYAGHRVLKARDGGEALASAVKLRPDLVITDILMPKIDAYEFVRRLRDEPAVASIPIIFYTPHYLERAARRVANVCTIGHVLTRPCEPDHVLRTVAAVLNLNTSSAPSVEELESGRLSQLNQELIQRVNELTAVNAQLSALVNLGLELDAQREPQHLLQSFCHAARDIAAARSAVVGVLDHEGRTLRYCFTSGLDAETASRLAAIPPWKGVLGKMLQQRRSCRLIKTESSAEKLGLPAAFPPCSSFLGAPLASPTRVYGWLCLMDKQDAAEFSVEDERLADILATQVSRSYENGRLYADVLRHAAELEKEVAERKRVEEAVKEREEKIRLLLDSTAEGIYGIDLQGECTFANSACARLLGYDSPNQLLGKKIHALIHHSRADGTPYPEEECPIYQAARQGKGSHHEGEAFWRADGSNILIECWSYPIRRGEQIVGAVVTFLDITDRRNLEDQFRQSQKMEAIGRLVGGVCHDFNNLLTIINGYSDLLQAALPRGEAMHEFAEQIRKAGERAVALTRQLLALSRKQMVQPEVLDLKTLLDDMGTMLRRLIGEDIDLQIVSDSDLWRVRASPGQIEQIILNLCVNARDAMPGGGILTIETHNIEWDSNYSSMHPGTPPGQYVQLVVSDSGHGMDAATQERIFEPFFTTKGEGKGTGLGLAIVHGIVEQSGGHIQIHSEVGVGTTIEIYLPREQRASSGRKSQPGVSRPYRGTESVLLVEDDDGVRSFIRMILERNGYKVLEARNGGEALLVCEQYKEPIQLLVSDVVMPQMRGGLLAERLASLQPAMKVLFISGYTDVAFLQESLEGDTPFLPKPFSSEVLTKKVREVLDERPQPLPS